MATEDALKKKVDSLVKDGQLTGARDLLDSEMLRAQGEEEKKKIGEFYTRSNKEILKGTPARTLFIDYDAFGESLEPAYYWTLDALKEYPFAYKTNKAEDYFAASEASFWYGDLGARRSALEKRATELVGTINVVIKSIINLLWDLKEFEQRLRHYEDYKVGGDKRKDANLALKAIFLTDVDIKKGRAAINSLATADLNFVTLRDAFMAAEKPEDVDRMDLNERVKRILKPRVKEYLDWVELSGRELKSRFSIEKAYLKSQVNALSLYTRWAKPYLIATNKLIPQELEKVTDADELVSAFDVARIYLEIFAKKDVAISTIKLPEDEEMFSVIEVRFVYRAIPGVVERGHFTHRGRIKITFTAFVMAKKHIKLLEEKKEDELLKLATGLTEDTLASIREDLDKYIKDGKPKEEKKKERKPIKIPIIEDMREFAKPLQEAAQSIRGMLPAPGPKTNKWDIGRVRKAAEEKAKKDLFKLYDNYKKMHGMVTW